MNSKIFIALLVLLSFLLLLGFYSGEKKVELSNVPVPNIVSADIDTIEISNFNNNLVLNKVNNIWNVASGLNYKANITKINSLLLKLLSPQSIQHIPYSETGITKLGLKDLSDTSFDINLLKGSESLSKIRLGKIKVKSEQSPSAGNPQENSSQYAMLSGVKKVMLLKSAILANVDPKSWIAKDLINILAKDVFSSESFSNKGSSKDLLFSITRPSVEEKKLNLEIPKGHKVINTLVNQSFSSLENVTIEDVKPLDTNVKFDRKTNFLLSNGLVYSAFTSDKFLKITVDFKPEVYKEALALYSSASKSDANTSKESEIKDTSKVNEKKEDLASPVIESSSLEVAKKLNDKFAKWQYQLPNYAHSKLRKNKKDFFEKENKEKK